MQVKNAYYISDIIEVTGTIEFNKQTTGWKKYCYLYDYYGDNDEEYVTYKLTDLTTIDKLNNATIKSTKVENEDTITIRAKVVETDNNTAYDDEWTVTEIESIEVKK